MCQIISACVTISLCKALRNLRGVKSWKRPPSVSYCTIHTHTYTHTHTHTHTHTYAHTHTHTHTHKCVHTNTVERRSERDGSSSNHPLPLSAYHLFLAACSFHPLKMERFALFSKRCLHVFPVASSWCWSILLRPGGFQPHRAHKSTSH